MQKERIMDKYAIVNANIITGKLDEDVVKGQSVIVENGKIAVTEASCPDHYCMNRGFCASGTDIVCLPNKLVIHFLGTQTVDAAAG